jgi:hypothetical protein
VSTAEQEREIWRKAYQDLAGPGWVVEYASRDGNYTEHLNGVPWHKAELPPWRHDCTPQTRGVIGLDTVERCACGATLFRGRGGWIEKNQTRISRGEKPGLVQQVRGKHRWWPWS